MSVISLSPETAYATKDNIVVDKYNPLAVATIASRAQARIQDVHPKLTTVTAASPKKES